MQSTQPSVLDIILYLLFYVLYSCYCLVSLKGTVWPTSGPTLASALRPWETGRGCLLETTVMLSTCTP